MAAVLDYDSEVPLVHVLTYGKAAACIQLLSNKEERSDNSLDSY